MNTHDCCPRDSKLHDAACKIRHLIEAEERLRCLDDQRRHQRDTLKRAVQHAYAVWLDPCSTPEAVCRAMGEMKQAWEW